MTRRCGTFGPPLGSPARAAPTANTTVPTRNTYVTKRQEVSIIPGAGLAKVFWAAKTTEGVFGWRSRRERRRDDRRARAQVKEAEALNLSRAFVRARDQYGQFVPRNWLLSESLHAGWAWSIREWIEWGWCVYSITRMPEGSHVGLTELGAQAAQDAHTRYELENLGA